MRLLSFILIVLLPWYSVAQDRGAKFNVSFLITGGKADTYFDPTVNSGRNFAKRRTGHTNFELVFGLPSTSDFQLGVGVGWSKNDILLTPDHNLSHPAYGIGISDAFEISTIDIQLEEMRIHQQTWTLPIYVEHTVRSEKNRDVLRFRAGIRNQFLLNRNYQPLATVPREPDELNASGNPLIDLIWIPFQLITEDFSDRSSISLAQTPYEGEVINFYAKTQRWYTASVVLQAEVVLFEKNHQGLAFTFGWDSSLRTPNALVKRTTGLSFGTNLRF